jgi:hypothetical protein
VVVQKDSPQRFVSASWCTVALVAKQLWRGCQYTCCIVYGGGTEMCWCSVVVEVVVVVVGGGTFLCGVVWGRACGASIVGES